MLICGKKIKQTQTVSRSALKQIRSFIMFLGSEKRSFSKSEKNSSPFWCNPGFILINWELMNDISIQVITKYLNKTRKRLSVKTPDFRIRIKRLTRRTICFSKSELMHDIVIGFYINAVEFLVDIHAKMQI